MSIEEMIVALETGQGVFVNRYQIIAALRAGQELADVVRKWDHGFISGREARKAVTAKREAFDAATGDSP